MELFMVDGVAALRWSLHLSRHASYTQASERGLGEVWGPLSISSAPLSLVFPRGMVLMPRPGRPRCLFALHTQA